MNGKMLKGILAVMLAMFGGSTALAAQYSCEYDYANNTVKISGTAENENAYTALQILTENKTFEDLRTEPDNSNMILYRYQVGANESEFSFAVEYGSLNPNRYCAKLVSGNMGEEFKIALVNANDYAEAVTELNELAAGDYSDFKNYIESKSSNLGLDLTLYNSLGDFTAYMNYVNKEKLNTEQSDKNIKDFNSFVLMGAIEESKMTNIKPYLSETTLKTGEAAADFLKLADTEEKQKYVTAAMNGRTMENFTEFENNLKECLILSEVRYASGYEDVQNILNKYGSVIGITDSVSSSVYKAMCGKSYKDGAALLEDYKKLSLNNSSPITGGGSGGNSGGFYGNVTNTAQPEKIHAEFNDIDGVEWAFEAILALADKGIINGRSKGYFKPNEFITREEFVKILVCALELQNEEYSNRFSDVKSDDWFVSYVNIAYKNGIVTGTGESKFGTGANISRQDMTVMLYNVLKQYNVNIQPKELAFDDTNKIAGYASEAVKALYGMGIMNGVSDTEFDPSGNATRAQAAKVVYGILNEIR